MELLQNNLLSLILFAPLVGVVLLLFIPSQYLTAHRWVAFGTSLITLGLTIVLWFAFQNVTKEPGFQFQEHYYWFRTINATYHLGVDGISVPMILLTGILMPLAILFSFSITERVKAYMILFLMLETGMLGVFMSLDLILFFLFWEIGLIPMYFLINIWGSAHGEREFLGYKVPSRVYASYKFFIYTMGGSLGLLLAIQLIGITLGGFDLLTAYEQWPTLTGLIYGIPVDTVRTVAFWAFVLAFAIKVPIWPFHTWLPDAHTEAPTAGSMILAGVLLKLGAYGFFRFVLPLYPAESHTYAPVLALLAMLSIVITAFSSFGQTDFKKLVAYSSVNHMGFVVMGIAATAWALGSPSEAVTNSAVMAANGAVLQMFNHGLSAAGMFLLVGVIYDRTHTRNLNDFGGLFPLAPVYGGILIFTSMASLGLPGLNGFVSEFLVVRGAFPIFSTNMAIATLGLFMTGAYILKGIQKVLHGPLNKKWVGHSLEISVRETFAIAPLMILMLILGVSPAWLVSVINDTVARMFN